MSQLPLRLAVMVLFFMGGAPTSGGQNAGLGYPQCIRVILEHTKRLPHARGKRLPLFLWPVHGGMVPEDPRQEYIIRDLDIRGVAMIASWNWADKEENLADCLRVARIQQQRGLMVCVNANACLYGFFNGEKDTAHMDDDGNPFFDPSIPGGRIGCPFRIEHRFGPMKQKIEFFARAYQDARVPLDLVFGDWEIDGPLEINRAWEAARKCRICRQRIEGIDDFVRFQQAVRGRRSEATRRCYVEPIKDRFPHVKISNYGVYPHDGYRYWYDYFEQAVDYHPHRTDGRATYRRWPHDFHATGYTFGMPVIYPWQRIYDWYDFADTDYRWFYNMLLIASSAGENTPRTTPLIPFVHWHTVFDGQGPDPRVRQMSRLAYQELLWHVLLRGADSLFLWCPDTQAAEEVALVHEVWSEALEFRDWLERGTPVTFNVPKEPGPVVSGLRIGRRVLVRRSDFGNQTPEVVTLPVDGGQLVVPHRPGVCQMLTIAQPKAPVSILQPAPTAGR